jgi:hypothetical protein
MRRAGPTARQLRERVADERQLDGAEKERLRDLIGT